MNYQDLKILERIHVYLDVSIDDLKCGRVVIELLKDHVPRTSENFRALCTGEKGLGGLRLPLHYKDTIFHKAVPECIVQGGDITNFDGSGGESIYGPHFEDENFIISHSEAGLLSTANRGMPHTNNSQFCVTLGPVEHLDNRHVVFGRVVKGFNIINNITYQPLKPDFLPTPVCKVWQCGELRPGQDWGYCDNDFSDQYPPYPSDWECDLSALQANEIIEVVSNIKDAGNNLMQKKDVVYAHQKYKKAMRYLEWYVEKHADDRRAVSQVWILCHLNAALSAMKLSYFREAIEHCNQVLNVEMNVKALFRRGLAREALNDHVDALEDLSSAQQLAPDDNTIATEISRINRFMSQYKESERLRYQRMFRT